MRTRPILAAALFACGAAATPAPASCLASRPVTSFYDDAYSFVYSPGRYTVSPQVEGVFWALGFADSTPGSGIDSGSLDALDFLAQYPGYGAYVYVSTNWNDARTDGCIDDATSTGTACAALALADRVPGCDPSSSSCVALGVVTAEVTSGAVVDFSLPGNAPISLERLPVAYLDYNPDHEWLPGNTPVIPAPTSGLYLDSACGLPIVGHRIWIARIGTPSYTPEPVRDGLDFELAYGGSGPGGEPLPFGVPVDIRFGCSIPSTHVQLAYSLVFEGGFETNALSLLRDPVSGSLATPCCVDADIDRACTTYEYGIDCDDTNPAVGPGFVQECDGLNNDCDHPSWPELSGTNEWDDDGDGFAECAGDCEDGAPSIFPGAGLPDVCNGLDDDCDGRSDEAPAFFEHIADPAGSAGARFGTAVAGLDDVDGDAVEDFIVGAYWDPASGHAQAGSATIFSGATRSALVKLVHPAPGAGDEFGRSVAAIGDVDGDGIDDVIVGAALDDLSGLADAGSAHVFSGSASAGFPWLYSLLDPAPSAGAEFGYSVEDVGDLDGDLVRDVIVGARRDGGTGSASLFSGATAVYLRKLVDPDGLADDRFGYAVGGIEDIDGDDVADVVIGAYRADAPGVADAGKVFVFSGSGGGIVRTLHDPAPTGGAEFGRSASAVADIDGDGIEDLLIGAPQAGGTGQALVFSGASGAFLDRVLDLDGQSGDGFGYRVDRGGDLDGDGVGDAVIGAFLDDGASGTNSGSATAISMATRSAIGKLVDPAAAAGDSFGFDVAMIGDVDGDGHPEILAAAYLRDAAAGIDAGGAVLFHGAAVEDLDRDTIGDRCDIDMDNDGVANDLDCAPRDSEVTSIPSEITGVRFWGDKTTLVWSDIAGSTVYDVFSGPIAAGLDGSACVVHGASYPQTGTATPAPGERWYYLVRGRNSCGTGTLGEATGGEERVPASECP